MSAFLVIPAAAARLLAGRFASMTRLSVAFGVSTALVGMVASNRLDIPSGATIVLTQGLLFVVCLIIAKALLPGRAAGKSPAPPP